MVKYGEECGMVKILQLKYFSQEMKPAGTEKLKFTGIVKET